MPRITGDNDAFLERLFLGDPNAFRPLERVKRNDCRTDPRGKGDRHARRHSGGISGRISRSIQAAEADIGRNYLT